MYVLFNYKFFAPDVVQLLTSITNSKSLFYYSFYVNKFINNLLYQNWHSQYELWKMHGIGIIKI